MTIVKGWAEEITASPGGNGSSYPYNSYDWETVYSVNGWVDDANREYDYGAIKLRGTPGDTTGWYGYRTTNGSDLDPEGGAVTVTGYPCEPPTGSWGTMWRDIGTVVDANTRILNHNADTTGCQSGSPVYRNYTDTGQTAIGIHTAGATSHNVSTRITNGVFDNIQAWSE